MVLNHMGATAGKSPFRLRLDFDSVKETPCGAYPFQRLLYPQLDRPAAASMPFSRFFNSLDQGVP